MKNKHNKLKKIEDELKTAYRFKNRTIRSADVKWRQDVMRSVRQVGPVATNNSSQFGFSQLSWKLAPAAFALILIFGILIFQVDDTLEYQLASQLIDDPIQSYLIYEPL